MATVSTRIDQNEVRRLMEAHDNQIDYVTSILDPVKFEELKAKVKSKVKDTQENKMAYLEALGESFSSIDDLMNSVKNLNQKINNANS